MLVRERVRSLVTDSVRVLGRDSSKSLVKKGVGASLRGNVRMLDRESQDIRMSGSEIETASGP